MAGLSEFVSTRRRDMPAGTCDPESRGETHNTLTLVYGDGLVVFEAKYGWDHISTKDSPNGCDGPLLQIGGWCIRVINNDSQTWYIHTKGRRGQPRNIPVQPGTTRRFSAGQAAALSWENASDLTDLTLSTSETAATQRKEV